MPRSPGAEPTDGRSSLTGGGRDLGGEIGFLFLDALAERIANKTGNPDRTGRFTFGFLQSLCHAFLVVKNERLLQQANFLVEGLQSRLDDLLDHVSRFTLLLELDGKHILLALNNGRI